MRQHARQLAEDLFEGDEEDEDNDDRSTLHASYQQVQRQGQGYSFGGEGVEGGRIDSIGGLGGAVNIGIPSSSLVDGDMGRGRGRGMNLPSWMTQI